MARAYTRVCCRCGVRKRMTDFHLLPGRKRERITGNDVVCRACLEPVDAVIVAADADVRVLVKALRDIAAGARHSQYGVLWYGERAESALMEIGVEI